MLVHTDQSRVSTSQATLNSCIASSTQSCKDVFVHVRALISNCTHKALQHGTPCPQLQHMHQMHMHMHMMNLHPTIQLLDLGGHARHVALQPQLEAMTAASEVDVDVLCRT